MSRGINYWQSADGKDKRLLFSINSYLQAIDATTGKSILTFGENGTVDLRIGLARSQYAGRIQSNSPGKIWKNLIILGSAAGEAFIAPPGDIRAYDVVTGHKVWQFHTIPLPGEFGYDTWPKEAYKYVGGANNWGSFSVDEERGIVYVPTGSANYDFYGADRVGQNLFANCLLALDAKTGKRLWHFQTVHHDLWDFDNVAAPQLDHGPSQRPEGRCGGARRQDQLPLRLRSRHRETVVADRGAAGAEERDARRKGLADAAVANQTCTVRQHDVHGGRRESVARHAGTVRSDEASGWRRPATKGHSHRRD